MPRSPPCVTGRSETFTSVDKATPCAAVVPADDVRLPRMRLDGGGRPPIELCIGRPPIELCIGRPIELRERGARARETPAPANGRRARAQRSEAEDASASAPLARALARPERAPRHGLARRATRLPGFMVLLSEARARSPL